MHLFYCKERGWSHIIKHSRILDILNCRPAQSSRGMSLIPHYHDLTIRDRPENERNGFCTFIQMVENLGRQKIKCHVLSLSNVLRRGGSMTQEFTKRQRNTESWTACSPYIRNTKHLLRFLWSVFQSSFYESSVSCVTNIWVTQCINPMMHLLLSSWVGYNPGGGHVLIRHPASAGFWPYLLIE